MKTFFVSAFIIINSFSTMAKEYHVAMHGNDMNNGSFDSPFRTIQAAANITLPGDTITVHAGVYREKVCHSRGGLSDKQRIVYRAAEGEDVQIKGSEVARNWSQIGKTVWKLTLSNDFFGDYNPYKVLIQGD